MKVAPALVGATGGRRIVFDVGDHGLDGYTITSFQRQEPGAVWRGEKETLVRHRLQIIQLEAVGSRDIGGWVGQVSPGLRIGWPPYLDLSLGTHPTHLAVPHHPRPCWRPHS